MSDDELRKLFAQKLNYYLNANGYNQADLARKMKVSTATTAKWCTGQTMPRIDKLQSICNWLGIEKGGLLEDRPERTDGYYINDEARELAQFLFDKPEYKVLFDAARKVKKEDIQFVKDLMDRMIGS